MEVPLTPLDGAITWLVVLAVCTTILVPAFGVEETPPTPKFDEWLESLGAPDWSTREEATERFLGGGEEAVAFLRSHQSALNPEIATRVRWLLAQLDPARGRAYVIRLAQTSEEGAVSSGQWQPREWALLDITEERSVHGSSHNVDGAPTKVEVALAFDKPTYELSGTLTRGDDVQPFDQAIFPGECAVILEEDLVEAEFRPARTRRDLVRSLWVVVFEPPSKGSTGSETPTGGSGAPPTPESLLDRIRQSVEEQVSTIDPLAQQAALALAGRIDGCELPKASELTERVLPWGLLARCRQGLPEAMTELEVWLGDSIEQERSPRHEAMILLTEKGSSIGLTTLLEHLDEFENWSNYRAIRALGARLDEDQDVEQILTGLSDPELYNWLPWSYAETGVLIQNLCERATPQQRAEMVRSLLPGVLAEYDPYGGRRVRTLLWALLSVRDQLSVDDWFEPLVGLLTSPQSREAFVILRQIFLEGAIDDEQWKEVVAGLEVAFSSEDNRSTSLNISLRPLFSVPEVSDDVILALWQARLVSYDAPTSLRSQVDNELVRRFGALEEKRPGREDNEAWAARKDIWLAKLEGANAEQLRGPTPDRPPRANQPDRPKAEEPKFPERLRLTTIEFRIDESGKSSEPLEFRSRELDVGRAYAECGPDASDHSTQILPPRSSRSRDTWWRLEGGRNLILGRPSLSRGRGRFQTYRVGSRTMGSRGVRGGADRDYQILYLLEDPAESVAVADWPALRDRVLAGFSELEGDDRQAWLDAVRMLYLREALPTIRAAFDESGDLDLSRTLLALGDSRGREAMLDGIRQFEGKNWLPAVETLESLLAAHDPEGLKLAIAWLIASDKKLDRFMGRLVDGVIEAVKALPSLPTDLDEDQLYRGLIASLDHRYTLRHVAPFLEKRLGLDFGYGALREIRSSKERGEMEKVIKDRCLQWWKNHSEERSKR